MDHMRQGTLNTSGLRSLVLDEADEMLRMGFIDDVEWILEQLPEERQVVLFSATMPNEIRRLSKRYLSEPAEITIKTKDREAKRIRHRSITLQNSHKLKHSILIHIQCLLHLRLRLSIKSRRILRN